MIPRAARRLARNTPGGCAPGGDIPYNRDMIRPGIALLATLLLAAPALFHYVNFFVGLGGERPVRILF